jgi:hypothetical protein
LETGGGGHPDVQTISAVKLVKIIAGVETFACICYMFLRRGTAVGDIIWPTSDVGWPTSSTARAPPVTKQFEAATLSWIIMKHHR